MKLQETVARLRRRANSAGAEAGMTLAEVLVTITILGLSIAGMTAALGAGSTASADHRMQVNADMVVRDYAESVKEWVRLGGYGSCAVGDNPVTGAKGTYNNTNVWNPQPEQAAYTVSMTSTSYQATQNYNVILLLDKSSSIAQFGSPPTGAVPEVRKAANAFIEGLANTSAYLSIVSLGNTAKVEPNATTVPLAVTGTVPDPATGTPATGNVAALESYVTGIAFGGRSAPYEYTNWEASLLKAIDLLSYLQAGPTTIVLVTDGDPTKWLDASGNVTGSDFPTSSSIATALAEAKGQSDTLRGWGYKLFIVGVGDVDDANIGKMFLPAAARQWTGTGDIAGYDWTKVSTYGQLQSTLNEVAGSLPPPDVYSTTCPTPEQGAQRIKLTATSPDGKDTESVEIIVREPHVKP